MKSSKQTRKENQLAATDIKSVRNRLTSENFQLDNYRSLGPNQKAVIDNLIKGQ